MEETDIFAGIYPRLRASFFFESSPCLLYSSSLLSTVFPSQRGSICLVIVNILRAMASQESSESKYEVDDAPLTKEMLDALEAVEKANAKAPKTPNRRQIQDSPSGSVRKRRRSSPPAESLITATRLRGSLSLKPTDKAVHAGLTPKSNHTLRREQPAEEESADITPRGPSVESRRSQSTGPILAGGDGAQVPVFYNHYGQPGPPHMYPPGTFPLSSVSQSYHPQPPYAHGVPHSFMPPPQGAGYAHAHGDYGQHPGFYPTYSSGMQPQPPPAMPYDARHEFMAPPNPNADHHPSQAHVASARDRHGSSAPPPDKMIGQSHQDHREPPALAAGRSDPSQGRLAPTELHHAFHESLAPPNPNADHPSQTHLASARDRHETSAPPPDKMVGQSHQDRREPPALAPGRSDPPQGRPAPTVLHHATHVNLPTAGPNATKDIFSPDYIPPASSLTSRMPHDRGGQASSELNGDHHNSTPPAKSSLVGSGVNPVQPLVVQPITPRAPAKFVGPVASPSPDHDLEIDEPVDYESLTDSPTVGRLSATKSEALKRGLTKIDKFLKELSVETGLSVPQIIDRWQLVQFRLPSLWNIYQQYFMENLQEELSRLPPEQQPRPGAVPNRKEISSAYTEFKAALGGSVYGKKLRTWYQLHGLSTTDDMTIGQREREFSKLDNKIQNISRHYSTRLGFEAVTIIVGSVINQDQNLGRVIMTPGAVDFFQERFRATDDVALSHLKAHVYDRVSKRIIAEDNGPTMQLPSTSRARTPAGIPGPSGQAPAVVQPARASSLVPTSIKTEATGDFDLNDLDKLENSQIVSVLRQKFEELGHQHNIAFLKKTKNASLLQWKNLVHLSSHAGYVFVNYPEGVDFPCDGLQEKHKDKSRVTKGISSLSRKALLALLASFDHPTHPLGLVKKYDEPIPEDEPVIIGAPPDAASSHSFGRRKFLDSHLTEDRKGPPRLAPGRSSKRLQMPSRKTPALSKKRKRKAVPSLDKFIVDSDDEVVSVDSYAPEEDGEGDDEDAAIQDRSPKRLRSTTTRRSKSVSFQDSKEAEEEEEAEGDDDDAGIQGSLSKRPRSTTTKRSKSVSFQDDMETDEDYVVEEEDEDEDAEEDTNEDADEEEEGGVSKRVYSRNKGKGRAQAPASTVGSGEIDDSPRASVVGSSTRPVTSRNKGKGRAQAPASTVGSGEIDDSPRASVVGSSTRPVTHLAKPASSTGKSAIDDRVPPSTSALSVRPATHAAKPASSVGRNTIRDSSHTSAGGSSTRSPQQALAANAAIGPGASATANGGSSLDCSPSAELADQVAQQIFDAPRLSKAAALEKTHHQVNSASNQTPAIPAGPRATDQSSRQVDGKDHPTPATQVERQTPDAGSSGMYTSGHPPYSYPSHVAYGAPPQHWHAAPPPQAWQHHMAAPPTAGSSAAFDQPNGPPGYVGGHSYSVPTSQHPAFSGPPHPSNYVYNPPPGQQHYASAAGPSYQNGYPYFNQHATQAAHARQWSPDSQQLQMPPDVGQGSGNAGGRDQSSDTKSKISEK